MVFLLCALSACDGDRSPTLDEMRRYRVSQLTDTQILALRQKAENESKLAQQRAIDAQNKEFKNSIKTAEKCGDFVFKVRHPTECNPPLSLIGAAPSERISPEDVFDDLLLGPCLLVDTVRAARRLKCLPPDGP